MKILFQNIVSFHTIVCDPDNGHNADAMSSYGFALEVVTIFLNLFFVYYFKLAHGGVNVFVEAGGVGDVFVHAFFFTVVCL